MNDSIPELREARELLGRLEVPRASRERVLAGLRKRALKRHQWAVRMGLAGAGMLVGVAAAAMGFGLSHGFREPHPSAQPAPVTSENRHEPQSLPDRNREARIPVSASAGDRERRPPAVSVPSNAGRSSAGGEPSELSQQVRAYEAAVALIPTSPTQALAALRSFRARWPRSAIGQEVDLRIVQTLVALGHADEARLAARAFVRRYPQNPRVSDLRTLAGMAEDPTAGTDH
jgi:TolA-binding protein